MPTAKITTKGQTTIPKEIRELLSLNPGDLIDFVVSDGKVFVQPVNVDVTQLKGILFKSDRKPVSVEEMNEAIAKNGGKMP